MVYGKLYSSWGLCVGTPFSSRGLDRHHQRLLNSRCYEVSNGCFPTGLGVVFVQFHSMDSTTQGCTCVIALSLCLPWCTALGMGSRDTKVLLDRARARARGFLPSLEIVAL